MKEMQIFSNPEFGKIRTIEGAGKTLFCGSDIAKALGYDQPHKAIKQHCKEDGGTIHTVIDNMGREQQAKFINEGNVYRLITHSKLPAAEKFELWVFDEVLPSIRKHGLYAVDELLNNPDMAIQAFTALKEEREKTRLLQSKIEEQQPLVHFANKVSDTSDLIDIGKMAKLLHDENINIGRNKLFDWLRKKNILMNNNTPYQKYVDSGRFKVREGTKEIPYGTKIFVTTYVTGKGQIYITEKLRNEFGRSS